MPNLNHSLAAWQTDQFPTCIKSEIEVLKPTTLPITQGRYIDDNYLEVIFIKDWEDKDSIFVEVGVYFNEILAGCSCGDDPMLEKTYSQLRVSIDKSTAEATFELIQD